MLYDPSGKVIAADLWFRKDAFRELFKGLPDVPLPRTLYGPDGKVISFGGTRTGYTVTCPLPERFKAKG